MLYLNTSIHSWAFNARRKGWTLAYTLEHLRIIGMQPEQRTHAFRGWLAGNPNRD